MTGIERVDRIIDRALSIVMVICAMYVLGVVVWAVTR